ncbi:sulfotransferase family protein [Hoeflea sp. WL0058]|uniref:Sulfotransferase family protein n=1 Tax=Flavimaribacter sediminis TaxID=2865987 RepID=A0AAE2ZU12_9HYPH|nr:sulfotransferase family 2 domain-containing protein [Flavimaribacter sediminis]MBW8639632.1 sulfotransferase family protein [Flavimaribacter sediminis]
MIISDTYGFAFVHIPKCGGSTVKHVISSYNETDLPIVGIHEHPALGRLDYAHIPLEVLREHFAKEFSKIEQYKAFALVRDPRERFFSALSQNQRMFSGTDITTMASRDVIRQCEKVCNYLQTLNGFCDPERIHFEKQSRYLDLDDKRVVDVVLPLHRLDLLVAGIGDSVHRKLKIGAPVNQTRIKRFGLRKSLADKNDKIYVKIRRSKIIPLFIKKIATNIMYTEFDHKIYINEMPTEIISFIDQYYKEDAVIYQNALQTQERWTLQA